jgi:predicted TIM-barrel fold metal-dependent hydrolase
VSKAAAILKKLSFFDSHLHIIDPSFPLYENQGFIPDPFTAKDYLNAVAPYQLLGGAIVSGSFQKQDQDYLIHALNKLGKNFVGVTQLFATTPNNKIIELDKAGVRAVRFNLRRGGSESISEISHFAERIYDVAGWHVEIYADAKDLEPIYNKLVKLPKLSIDHLGLSKQGLPTLLRLIDKGAHVKATGFGRLDFEPEWGVAAIFRANPDSLMFGTDLPSTRAPRPFLETDFELIHRSLGDKATKKVFFENALKFYSLS